MSSLPKLVSLCMEPEAEAPTYQPSRVEISKSAFAVLIPVRKDSRMAVLRRNCFILWFVFSLLKSSEKISELSDRWARIVNRVF